MTVVNAGPPLTAALARGRRRSGRAPEAHGQGNLAGHPEARHEVLRHEAGGRSEGHPHRDVSGDPHRASRGHTTGAGVHTRSTCRLPGQSLPPPPPQGPAKDVKFVEDMAPNEVAQAGIVLPPGLVNVGNTCYMNSTLQVRREGAGRLLPTLTFALPLPPPRVASPAPCDPVPARDARAAARRGGDAQPGQFSHRLPEPAVQAHGSDGGTGDAGSLCERARSGPRPATAPDFPCGIGPTIAPRPCAPRRCT